MHADDLPQPEEQWAALLAACDDALAAGNPVVPLAEDVPAELRPRLRRGLACLQLLEDFWPRTADTPPRAAAAVAVVPPAALGRFQIVRELGRGGFGIVYLAHDPLLGREVALKVPRTGALLDSDGRERFLREARAAAALDHPNLVPVHEAGTVGEVCYIASAYCPGASLADWLRRRTELVPERAAAAVVASLAEAVQHAHDRGVVHRDLKPANVLLVPCSAEAGWEGLDLETGFVPRVTDFGLARFVAAGATAGGGQTESGAVVGTPCYMAPEQAAGKTRDVGPAADVYALGAILYECLTGRPPFQAETVLETLLQVQIEEPVPPSRLRPRLRRDLETVCLKCLHKEPKKRYASAQDLADDLRRFLSGEPVRARPVGAWERGWRWGRRNPAQALTAAVTTAALVAAVGGVVGFAVYQADVNSKLSAANTEKADANRKLSDTNTDLVNAEKARHKFTRLSAVLALDKGLQLCENDELHAGVRMLATALEINPPDEDHLAAVIRANLAGWGSRLSPVIAVLPHEGTVRAVAFSPDGRTLLTAGDDGKARLWDAATGRPLEVLDHGDKIQSVAFSPDGKRILTGGSGPAVRQWDATTGRPAGGPLPIAVRVNAVAYSPDGKTAATASRDSVQLWDVTADPPVPQRELAPRAEIRALAFSPDGTRLLTGCSDSKARLWDVDTGKLWDEATGRPWNTPTHHMPLGVVAFSRDGGTILTTSDDGTARLSKADTGELLPGSFETSPARTYLFAAALSPNGEQLLLGDYAGRAMLLDVAWGGRRAAASLRHPGTIFAVAFSPDGTLILTGGADKTARLWRLAPVEPATLVGRHDGVPRAAAFSPDGKTALVGCADGTVRRWDLTTGGWMAEPLALGAAVEAVAFHPDGKTFVTAGEDKQVRRWDAATLQPVGPLLPHPRAIQGLAFSHDGKTLVTGCADGQARRWDVDSGRELGPPLVHDKAVRAVAFSPDGLTILTGSDDRTARFWDAANGRPLPLTLPMHHYPVDAVAFSPNGTMVLTATGSQAYLWEAATGTPLGSAVTMRGRVQGVAFSADGQTFLTVDTSWGEVRLWDLATRKQLGAPLTHHYMSIKGVAFSPDGGRVLTAGSDRAARVWQVPAPMGGTVEEVVRWAQQSTALEPDEYDALRSIDPQTWLDLRRAHEAAGGPFPH